MKDGWGTLRTVCRYTGRLWRLIARLPLVTRLPRSEYHCRCARFIAIRLSLIITAPIMYARLMSIVVIRSNRRPRDAVRFGQIRPRFLQAHSTVWSKSKKDDRCAPRSFFELSFGFSYMKCYVIYIGYFPPESNCPTPLAAGTTGLLCQRHRWPNSFLISFLRPPIPPGRVHK